MRVMTLLKLILSLIMLVVTMSTSEYDIITENISSINEPDPDVWLNEGNTLQNLEKYNEPAKYFNEATYLNRSYADAWDGMGDAFLNMSKYEYAIRCYDKVIELDSKSSEAQNKITLVGLIIRYDIEQKELETKVSEIRQKGDQINRELNDVVNEYNELNRSYQQMQQECSPYNMMGEALDYSTGSLVTSFIPYSIGNIVSLTDIPQGVDIIEKSIDCVKWTAEGPKEYREKSRELQLKKQKLESDRNECQIQYNDVLENLARIWNDKGIVFHELGMYENAISCYDEALKIDPKYSEAWYNKDVALRALGFDAEAIPLSEPTADQE